MPVNVGALAGGFVEAAAEQLLTYGVGVALSEALRPEAVRLGQEAWHVDPTQALGPGEAARVAAEDVDTYPSMEDEARYSGIDSRRFRLLVREILTVPGLPELLNLWRRDAIQDADFLHGLRKLKLETRWDAPLESLKDQRLDPAVIATGIQRGIIADPGLLPVGPPSAAGRVPPMPVAAIDALQEAAAHGVNRERLAAITRQVGLPPAPGELLQLVNRGHIDEVDYYRGIAEGNTRNEWASFLLHLKRRIMTPHEYAELRLRGWIDDAAMYEGGRLSGMEDHDTFLLHELIGRPITVRQVTTGEARGGHFDGDPSGIPTPFLRSLQQGNLRPEWYSLAYANRYTLPSAFVLRRLAADGAVTQAETEQILLDSGWKPDLAAKVAHAYAPTQGGATKHLTATQRLDEYEGHYITRDQFLADLAAVGWSHADAVEFAQLADARRVKAARDSRLKRIQAAFVDHRLHTDQARADLSATGIPAEAQTLLLAQWEGEREANVAKLTPAQVKKAFTSNIYSRAVALAELEFRGYTPGDAATLLDE